MDRRGNCLHFSIFSAYVSTRHDNMAVELASNFHAIFKDSGLGANLDYARFNDFNQINRDNFFEGHDISF